MRLTRRQFSRFLQQALEELPTAVTAVLDNADILVRDWPTAEQLDSVGLADRYDLFGLYEGIPQAQRSTADTMVLPDRITLFQRPIEAACRSGDKVLQEIKTTIVHEVAHHLGWSDEELERMGYG